MMLSSTDIAHDLPDYEGARLYLEGKLHDDSSLQESVYVINIIFGILVLVALSLRLFVRLYMIRAAGVDDALIVVAAISASVFFLATLAGVHIGLGKHVWNLDTIRYNISGETSKIVKIEFGAYIAYTSAISFTKLSIIMSYVRIFPQRVVRRISYATGLIVLAFWICSLLAICFACYPIEAIWDWRIAGATCFPLVNYLYVAAVFNITTDVVICILPIPTLWSLKMPKIQRIVVSVLFSFGIFVCIASLLRMTRLHDLTGSDLTYKTAATINWSAAEIGAAIFCTCMSVLRPLASKVFPGFFKRLFYQESCSALGSNSTTKCSNSPRQQTSERSFISCEETDSLFELIYQRPDTPESFRPPVPIKDRVYLVSRNAIRPTG